jgi:hypothetical protein
MNVYVCIRIYTLESRDISRYSQRLEFRDLILLSRQEK